MKTQTITESCNEFTPKLEEFYRQSKNDGKPFEIVYASLDRNKEEYQQTLSSKHGPWLALGFKDPQVANLQTKFGVHGIPTLLIMNGKDGKVLSREGRRDIQELGQGAWNKWNKERGGSTSSIGGVWSSVSSMFGGRK